MLLTEEDAKEKWCPHVRGIRGHGDVENVKWSGAQPVFNRIFTDETWVAPKGAACMGLLCMAWRSEDAAEARGYCGLVGKP
jgi:hypothetical protein